MASRIRSTPLAVGSQIFSLDLTYIYRVEYKAVRDIINRLHGYKE